MMQRQRKPQDHPRWSGGRINHQGYVMVRSDDHPRNHKGYVFEHILVMEEHIGRHLIKGEVIHHINGDSSDNRIDNLRLYSSNRDHLKETLWENGKKNLP